MHDVAKKIIKLLIFFFFAVAVEFLKDVFVSVDW